MARRLITSLILLAATAVSAASAETGAADNLPAAILELKLTSDSLFTGRQAPGFLFRTPAAGSEIPFTPVSDTETHAALFDSAFSELDAHFAAALLKLQEKRRASLRGMGLKSQPVRRQYEFLVERRLFGGSGG